jgi:voltage-gated potassium channel
MRLPYHLNRRIEGFLDDPASLRNAAWLIIGATVVAVVLGGVVVWLFDHDEYPNLGRALWFTLQTVTTVGYGDVTPRRPVGRIVGALVMLAGISFITIVTASVTSIFVEAARRRTARDAGDGAMHASPANDALADMNTRLARIEETLAALLQQSQSVDADPNVSDR